MTAKHAGMPLYGSDVTPKIYPASTSVAAAGESPSTMVTIPIPAPVFKPDPVDTLPYVPDMEEGEEDEIQTPEVPDTVTAPPSEPESSQAEPPTQVLILTQ